MRTHLTAFAALAAVMGIAADVRAQAPDVPPPRPDAAPAPAGTDDDLRRELRSAMERLARQEAELEKLKASIDAKTAAPPAPPPVPAVEPPPPKSEPWYERLHIRGYTQIRYNKIPSGVDNENLINDQGDKSIGGTGGIFIRRARVILYGDVHPRVSLYIQPDFASAIGDQQHVAILRDFYADVFLDAKKEFRFRIGQSKVPFGFENLQSSQNRLPLDRNDALNSALKDERDLGLFFYWAPDHIRKRFKHLVDGGLKGSGDYGVIGLGVYNGQTANRLELNKTPHVVARVTWPFAIGKQILEIGGGGYYGEYTVALADQKDSMGNTVKYTSTDPKNSLVDARVHASVVLYPQPFGLAAEYNVGWGPSQGAPGSSDRTLIDSRFLKGGYLQLMYKIDHPLGTVALIPYVRGTMYDGGKKFNTNAPYYEVRELEFGFEWQIAKALEIVAAYMISDRTSDKFPYKQEYGHVTRLQVQINY